ncbi:hypothetical protein [Streptomyces sp. PanSC19]|uniref:hypothetical protein n=1 Tax=Streptomyces sp. PanSC19 TaxID=1520455 RepID=UPI0021A434AA|nr:hypothetical protein [Streptomyces sp. PanSC19]
MITRPVLSKAMSGTADPPLLPLPDRVAELLSELACFAATHASWADERVGTDDLLVGLADKIWKNKRVPDLEDLVVARPAEATGRPAWEEFIALDEVLSGIGEAADERLAFQASFPIHG